MRGAARRRFESLLPAHPALRAAAQAWHERLLPLTASLLPVQPSGEVWRRISDRIGAGQGAPASATTGAWRRLSLWRGLTAFASVAAIGFAAMALVALLQEHWSNVSAGAPAIIGTSANAAFWAMFAVGGGVMWFRDRHRLT